ncbi:MAG: transporter [Bdellovibrio sp. CG12_big_fil_rev_8_21_14_0_65_39_13]|nr:MAG: transporter [Bdellovibrio sp. CG22_combo_CG10-13_8_21_14_all_39_27]PIQ61159.1 MAG: transporter [Bdellovibrio sp. CG12_big_fil_rev_8_21_14_0_65_39_13]PIR34831.1 MAG: transporter [Bdellovibrio sp. CG11_big_fil_rev_8_21_14_0_20_39_38]
MESLTYLKDMWGYLTHPLFEINGHAFSFMSMVTAIAIFVIGLKLSKVAEKIIGNFFSDKGVEKGVQASVERITRYIVMITAMFMALDTVGVSLKSLAALGAVLMVGIGFGLQNIAQNFISGLIILLERPVRVGDLIKVGDITGKITDISARYTVVQTRDDISIIVPNSQLISEQVTSQTFNSEQIRFGVDVGVAYGSDVRLVEKILFDVAMMHKDVLKNPAPSVFFTNFGESSLDFRLLVWVEDLWHYEKILSDLRFAIDQSFRDHNVTIPFPQRDLHIVSGLEKRF